VSSPGQVAGATQQAAGQTASAAKDEAAQVGSTAAAAASDVAGTTKQQAGAVAGEAVSQVRDLLDQTRAQVSQQAGGAQEKLGESLRTLSDELRSMGDGSGSGSGPAAELARTLAEKGTAFADYLSGKQPGELVQELRSLAARRPGGFLLGSLVAGIAAGRLVRGATSGQSQSGQYPSSGPYTATGAYPPTARPLPPLPIAHDERAYVDPPYESEITTVYPTGGYPDVDAPGSVPPGTRATPHGAGPGL